jgi:hypothetical protein
MFTSLAKVRKNSNDWGPIGSETDRKNVFQKYQTMAMNGCQEGLKVASPSPIIHLGKGNFLLNGQVWFHWLVIPFSKKDPPRCAFKEEA